MHSDFKPNKANWITVKDSEGNQIEINTEIAYKYKKFKKIY